jgi:hypothetical protein
MVKGSDSKTEREGKGKRSDAKCRGPRPCTPDLPQLLAPVRSKLAAFDFPSGSSDSRPEMKRMWYHCGELACRWYVCTSEKCNREQ